MPHAACMEVCPVQASDIYVSYVLDVCTPVCTPVCLHASELFELVVDWPDSLPALDDLTECLRHTREHSRLVTQLRAQVHGMYAVS